MEAVMDIDCDLPPTLNFDEVEKLGMEAFGTRYPIRREQFIQQAGVDMKPDSEPKFFASQGLSAFQFVSEDEKEVVQIRVGGFSYNRMAPYTSFDDYLPEISRCWDEFCRLASPVQIRKIGLRYINRILIPLDGGRINLAEYLKVSPNLPDGAGLQFAGFFHQHQAGDPATGTIANIILASQPNEDTFLPLLLDIEVFKSERLPPAPLLDWSSQIQSLRDLNNHIFKHSLTETCLSLFH
ncbi:MAG: TIGR04255 family protein [Akkermansiaceae bacterium]|nr:TIGR04255 family protein [Akkermansiaceae bacterium]